jgi:hypothetical protein
MESWIQINQKLPSLFLSCANALALASNNCQEAKVHRAVELAKALLARHATTKTGPTDNNVRAHFDL